MSRRASEPTERVAAILDPDGGPQARPGPLEVPSTLAGGRYGVSRQAVIGVLLVVLVAVVVLGGRALLARHDGAPEPVGSIEEAGDRAPFAGGAGLPGPESPGATDAPGATGAPGMPAASGAPVAIGASATTAAEVTVHVVGQVGRPGIVTLPLGSRVADALDSVGGTSAKADLAGINLARALVDGEQVLVPTPGQARAPAGGVGAPAAAGGPAVPGPPPAPGAPSVAGAPAAAGALVNLNTADLTTLEGLPGIGPVLAQRVLDWRAEHGRFTTVEELGEVSGIGEKIFAQLAPKVTV